MTRLILFSDILSLTFVLLNSLLSNHIELMFNWSFALAGFNSPCSNNEIPVQGQEYNSCILFVWWVWVWIKGTDVLISLGVQ